MDKIYGILERHERWIETLEPTGDDPMKLAHWNEILCQVERNLCAHQKLIEIKEHTEPTTRRTV